jgi:iron-sulfur cluster repair protein YtfE (RIC family)
VRLPTWSCAQDLYQQPISKLVEFIIAAYHDNPDINLEVFVHKAEKMPEEDKLGLYDSDPLRIAH